MCGVCGSVIEEGVISNFMYFPAFSQLYLVNHIGSGEWQPSIISYRFDHCSRVVQVVNRSKAEKHPKF